MMKYVISLLLLVLAGCASSPKHEIVVSAKAPSEALNLEETEVTLTSNGDDFAKWSKSLPSGVCSTSFTATIDEVHPHQNGDSFAQAIFFNDTIDKHFFLMFYADPASEKIQTLIWHSDDDGAEFFGREFKMDQDITAMVWVFESKDFMIAIEPESSADNLLGGDGSTLKNKAFDSKIVDVGFIPERLTLQTYGVDATFKQVRLGGDC